MAKNSNPEKTITVELPAKYWVVVMAALHNAIQTYVKPETDRLREEGESVDDLAPELVTVLVGPVVSLGVITKAMHEAGEVTDAGNEKMGIDSLMRRVSEHT